MALKRWVWVWAPVAAATLAAIMFLPGGGEPGRSLLTFLWGSFSGEHRASYRADVHRALDMQRSRLQDARRADSLIAAARGARAVRASSDPLTTVLYERPLAAADARGWLEAAEQELARYPAGATRGAPLLVALYSDAARLQNRANALWFGTVRRLPPDAPTSPCIAEVNLLPRGPRARGSRTSPGSLGPFLGLCALIRRFGAPGPAVARWIGSTGWRAADRTDGGLMSLLSEARRAVPQVEIARPNLSSSQPWEWYWGTPWVTIGCLDGTWSLCERNARIRLGDYDWWWYSDPRQMQLIAFVLASGTPEQFTAFWRSPLGVSDALQQAYGRPAGQLAYEAFSHWYRADPGGPRAGPKLLLAGLFWAAAALALALVAGRRWTTEI